MPIALLTGVGFGLGRSGPIATGLLARGRLSPATVAAGFSQIGDTYRVAGCLIALGMLAGVTVQIA